MAYLPPWFETPEEQAARMRHAALGMDSVPSLQIPGLRFPGGGTGESNYGSAPYVEAAARAQARLGLRDRLLAGLSGLAQVPPGANFGQAFLAAAGGSARATWAAKQAAMNYAQRQAEQEIARQNAETQRMLAERPPKEPKPEKLEPWQLSPEDQDKIIAFEARKAKALADAKPKPIPKAPAVKVAKAPPPAKPSSGQERTALSYYNRMKDAEGTIQKLEPTIAKQSPLDQIRLQSAPNYLQSADQQVYRQAQRAFTEARLRKESGAAIPQQEYDNDARTYFAQPGDMPAVVERKRKARQAVLAGLKFASGKAYQEFYGSGSGADSTNNADPLGIR